MVELNKCLEFKGNLIGGHGSCSIKAEAENDALKAKGKARKAFGGL